VNKKKKMKGRQPMTVRKKELLNGRKKVPLCEKKKGMQTERGRPVLQLLEPTQIEKNLQCDLH
jgi:hypothetical protein